MPTRWTDAPLEFGCLYHKRARFHHRTGTVTVDVFVMPKIAHQRPIALTISNYSLEGAQTKNKYSLDDPEGAAGTSRDFEEILLTVDCSIDSARAYAHEIEDFLVSETATLRSVLASIS